eukprot:gnl/MRDRNA2_/MRDRNA2_29450_c0_seq1.p1 gnl/MRDRNA2_/MRDRNA2_29450_c0~~gnl/MRDRNA2_/MRDRNA2_29450_c0_seq1.p1  ORF type:complete len:172 (-),score=35.56 gnl/MRDRNA2_/MRDRNA2_29450_c0_seq1:148-663(-)
MCLRLRIMILSLVAPAVTAKCKSDSTACFSIMSTTAHFSNATVPSGYDYGVDVYYGKDQERSTNYLFAQVWDSDGDMFVNITGGNGGYCIIDIGATMGPYVRLMEQNGLACDFTMTKPSGTASGQTFLYTLKTTRHEDASVDCKSDWHAPKAHCPQPPQPPTAEAAATVLV